MKTSLMIASSTDPWLNMAVEEYLFNHVSGDEMILYLWQVQSTVMIGKHQNPLKECRCEQLENEGGNLARRLSGGGAVFQDLGTLMFSFISDRLSTQCELVNAMPTLSCSAARFNKVSKKAGSA